MTRGEWMKLISRVFGEWKYLYRAVDSQGNTLDNMIERQKGCTCASERFFRKVLKAEHNQTPRVINVDKNAAYPPAIDSLTQDQTLRSNY
jgi:transposase-like protein